MPRRQLALLVLGVAAVSFSAVLFRLGDAPPFAVAFYRCVMAGAVLLPISLISDRNAFKAFTPRSFGLSLLSGVFLALHFATWIPSLDLTTVAASTVLVTTSPLWVALLGRVIGERMSRRAVAGVVVALAGTLVITGGGAGTGLRTAGGDLLALGGALFAAAYVMAGRTLRRDLPVLPYVIVVYSTCAVCMAGAMAVSHEPFTGYSPRTWLLLAAMTAGPQLLGHTVFNLLLGHLPASVVTISIMAEPVGATVLALVLLGEVPALVTLIGGAIVLAGVYVGVTSQTRERVAESVPLE